MRIFYTIYKNKIGQSLIDEFYKLSWTHYCELIKIDDKTKRNYFEKYAISEIPKLVKELENHSKK